MSVGCLGLLARHLYVRSVDGDPVWPGLVLTLVLLALAGGVGVLVRCVQVVRQRQENAAAARRAAQWQADQAARAAAQARAAQEMAACQQLEELLRQAGLL